MTGTILLVEDDEPLRSTLARHLQGVGHDVVQVDSTEDAAARLRAGLRPAIVLLDINLPGETGWSLLRGSDLLRAGSPPVVVTSATTISPRRLREYGVAGYLPKPFPLETLRSTVDRLLTRAESDR